ncbi:MAG: MBL fold metallo-hydrolase [Acidimicrobiales bacterium]|jgi:glyoxylase-like metal-dependent hydrolase (beta-lactamase superfamily II)
MTDRFYFRQLLSGLDFALDDPVAEQMVNFAYAFGDRDSGDAVLVDPAYRPSELVDLVESDGMRVSAVFATHYHPDHVGGNLGGRAQIDGITELLERIDVPIHVQGDEVEWVTRVTGVGEDSLIAHDPGDVVAVGDFEVALIHTPGHTPGSQCLLVNGRLISGDTLFLDGCGRTDLPGSDPNEMYRTLTQRLSNIADDTVLFPGHLYSADPSAPMGDVRRHNRALVPASAEQWLAMFAG